MERITDRERAYVLEVLETQFRTSSGTNMTKRLEEKFAETFQSRFAISFINGTATMHAALIAAGIKPGDEVIVPPLTFAATAFATIHAHAVPVFADIEPDTWTIDPRSIEKCISPRTKAIIPVSIYGLSPDMDAIMGIARRYSLFVLEDDAQCFLGYYKGRVVGSIAHVSSFSFQSSKHITSGQGGMIVTNDEALAETIRRLNSLGYAGLGAQAGQGKISKETIQDPGYERHVSLGWNYRMPELCAAVALGQVERLQELVSVRQQVATLYSEAHANCNWLTAQTVPEGYVHAYWTYVLKLDPTTVSWHEFYRKYRAYGGDGIYAAWQLTYLEPALRNVILRVEQPQIFEQGLCPVAELVQPQLLQFKTNYYDAAQADQQAEAMARTIAYFN